MHRAPWIFALAAGCAAVHGVPIDTPDGDVGDLASGGDDLAGANDLARGDAGPADFSTGGDLTSSGCGLGQVVVNEVQTSGTGGATDEWVELYNPCTTVVNLAGCKLAYRSATNSTPNDTFTLAPLNLTIAANGYLLIANGGYAGPPAADIKPFAAGGLADTGGGVGLRDPSNQLIDSMGWGSATNPFVETASANNGAGQSMARTPNGTDTNNNLNDFKVATPTPRAPN